jgi:hypothetical protein
MYIPEAREDIRHTQGTSHHCLYRSAAELRNQQCGFAPSTMDQQGGAALNTLAPKTAPRPINLWLLFVTFLLLSYVRSPWSLLYTWTIVSDFYLQSGLPRAQ